jgi:hypothetical protein
MTHHEVGTREEWLGARREPEHARRLPGLHVFH